MLFFKISYYVLLTPVYSISILNLSKKLSLEYLKEKHRITNSKFFVFNYFKLQFTYVKSMLTIGRNSDKQFQLLNLAITNTFRYCIMLTL